MFHRGKFSLETLRLNNIRLPNDERRFANAITIQGETCASTSDGRAMPIIDLLQRIESRLGGDATRSRDNDDPEGPARPNDDDGWRKRSLVCPICGHEPCFPRPHHVPYTGISIASKRLFGPPGKFRGGTLRPGLPGDLRTDSDICESRDLSGHSGPANEHRLPTPGEVSAVDFVAAEESRNPPSEGEIDSESPCLEIWRQIDRGF